MLPSTPSCLKAIIFSRSTSRLADRDAEIAEMCLGLLELFGRMQESLRGDAADVEAGAAVRLALLDDGGLQAELRGANRAHANRRARFR